MSDALEIQHLIGRFLASFDRHDWRAMGEALCPSVRVDYSDLRGEPPREISAHDYVESRREALAALATHHLAGSFDVEADADEGVARVSCAIFRRSGERFFNSHALYEYAVSRLESGWRIRGIRQTILFNEGDPEIHPGARSPPEPCASPTAARRAARPGADDGEG